METHRIPPEDPIDTPPDDSRQLRAGTTLVNRYLIQSVIGVGGMGAVYRARDLHFPNVVKLVAVKEMVILAPDPIVRRTIVRNFEREANLLATLDHRAIPRIYDYFTINDRSYLVLEFISGKDLETLINETEGFLPQELLIGWAIELCDVLHFLHNHKPEPLVFRDIKPSNIMINNHEHVVLVDFGIAKPFQAGQKGTMIGTEGYSPPEQYRGEATPLADIYSLGATLHHALTRRDPRLEPPFSFAERPIRQFNPDVLPELEAIINKALQYEPEDRQESAEGMKDALLRLARTTGPLRSGGLKFRTAGKGDVQPLWTFRCEDEIRGTPTEDNGVVYVGSYDHNLYALNAATGEFIWKFPAEGGVVSRPAVHDGSVFTGSEDHRLYVVSSRSGKMNWAFTTQGPVRSSPFIAEGHVFIGSDDHRLYAINTITGRRSWSIDFGSAVRSTPLVENEHIYFGTETGDFYCLDLGGSVRWRFSARRAVTSSPVISQGVVYFGSVDSTLYALDAKTGWVIWRFRLNRPTISTPYAAGELLYTGAVDGNIYAIEAASAKEVWRFSTEHQVTGSPVLHRDVVYCGSVDGRVYAIDHRTGKLRWKYETKGPITGSPAAVNDMIYIGSTDHTLYALPAA